MICPDWRGERLPIRSTSLYSVQLPPAVKLPDFAALHETRIWNEFLFGPERDQPPA